MATAIVIGAIAMGAVVIGAIIVIGVGVARAATSAMFAFGASTMAISFGSIAAFAGADPS